MNEDISYVGLDVHKNSIQAALLLPGDDTPIEWSFRNTPEKVRQFIGRLRRKATRDVRLCYEAGPTGYSLHRDLNAIDGFRCQVIAPSLIPRKPGQRVKTNRRDARQLAEYLRGGLLTEVASPSEDDEAVRELCRARGAAKDDEKRAKQRIAKFLLRQGRVYPGKSAWTQKHRTWLARQRFERPHLQVVFDDLVRALETASDRVRGLEARIEEASTQEEVLAVPVALLRCFRGIDTITAMTLATELYGFERFESPRGLMAYLGLVPSEHSTGDSATRGSITKAGNGHVRRALIESAWCCIRTPRVGRALARRREGQPGWMVALADRAMHRLHRRYWRLVSKGKPACKAVTAIARELVGFIWAALMEHRLQAGGEGVLILDEAEA